jgi:hypothetical protein
LFENIKLFGPSGWHRDCLWGISPYGPGKAAGIDTRFRRLPLISVRQSPQLSKARRFGVNATAFFLSIPNGGID